MIAVDTNVLIYAHRGETEFHDRAVSQLRFLAAGAERWALPVFCVTEFMRVVTHKRVFSPPSSIAQAAAFIEGMVAVPTCEVVRPGGAFIDRLLAAAHEADARGNLMFDVQIVALCREHGVDEVLTNDRDFERFDGLRVRRLD